MSAIFQIACEKLPNIQLASEQESSSSNSSGRVSNTLTLLPDYLDWWLDDGAGSSVCLCLCVWVWRLVDGAQGEEERKRRSTVVKTSARRRTDAPCGRYSTFKSPPFTTDFCLPAVRHCQLTAIPTSRLGNYIAVTSSGRQRNLSGPIQIRWVGFSKSSGCDLLFSTGFQEAEEKRYNLTNTFVVFSHG